MSRLKCVAKKGYMLGNNGRSKVIVISSSGQTAFIEKTTSGNIITTAIDSKLNSVHSRNSVLFGKIIASQYYGSCVIKEKPRAQPTQ